MKPIKRPIGLHLRLATTVLDLLKKADALSMSVMQCFFLMQSNNVYGEFTVEDEKECAQLRKRFSALFIHASYWVNLAGKYKNGWKAFKRELELAKRASFSHMIIHPGSATGCLEKKEGIEYLARALNSILKEEETIKIVLENTAHANKTIGGDINDFYELLQLLDQPEKISFCIDSAHAFSYGYPINTQEGLNEFIILIEKLLGKEKIVLLHLNDSVDPCGSKIDKHEVPGKGMIGKESLMNCMNHSFFKDIPIILETPLLTDEEEKKILQEIIGWDI